MTTQPKPAVLCAFEKDGGVEPMADAEIIEWLFDNEAVTTIGGAAYTFSQDVVMMPPGMRERFVELGLVNP